MLRKLFLGTREVPGSPEGDSAPKTKSYWSSAKKEFKKNRPAYFAFWVIIGLITLAILSDFIAYNKPYYAVYKGETYYPLFNDYLEGVGLYEWDAEMRKVEWREIDSELESSLWPPICYLPGDIDDMNMQSVSPSEKQRLPDDKFWHYLGTDELGRDLLSGLIHGTRISLAVGVIAAGISAIIGILIGSIAGYFGDNRLKLSRAKLILLLLGIFLGLFYGFFVRGYTLSDSIGSSIGAFLFQLLLSIVIAVGIISLFSFLGRFFGNVPWLKEKIFVPVDILISRLIELMVSIPILLLIITVASVAEPSLFLVMAVIGLTSWTRIARLTRAELLKVRSLEYIQAAQAQGFSEFRIIFRHALPNSLAPVFIAIAFGVASAILFESALSFLGIGVPVTTITWGSLLNAARGAPSAWWLAVFPGLAIFLTVTCFNLVGEGLRDALDPRLKK